ncbi:hypothetical protein BBP40_008114 [Aspergillus hancockii]|nr:hypothetical protein BBP40_008114 [Aspergillus hancockii]
MRGGEVIHSFLLIANNNTVLGRTSVTGSPAPSILDLTPKNSRRSSSRASRKATRELELSTSHPSRLAYSLPPTPITSSFEEALSSSQRAKRHRSVNYYERTPHTKGAETPDQKNASFSAQPSGSTSRKSSRSRKSDNPNKEAVKAPDSTGDQTVTLSTSNTKRNSQPEQSSLHTYLHKPQDRRKTLATQAETSEKNNPQPDTKPSTMNTTTSSSRKTRKSMPAKLNDPESADKATPKSQVATRQSSPQPRRDRKSKSFLRHERVSKQTPRVKPQSTPAANSASKSAKVKGNGDTNPITPAEGLHVSTPKSSTTRSRRRDRKSARKAAMDRPQPANEPSQATTATNTDAEDNKPAAQDSINGGPQPQRTGKRQSNTVTLNLGRKSLESFVRKTLESDSYGNEIADSVEGTPVHVYDDSFHFDYDTDMYRNNFGLDGQIDTPASPTSFSTTTSTAARASRRARKPTIRALESFESERRFRRPRPQTPGKVESSAAEGSGEKTNSEQKSEPQSKTQTTEATPAPPANQQPDVTALARRIFDLAAASVSVDFVPAPESDTWLEELRKEFQGKEEAEAAETEAVEVAEAAEAVVEGESRPPSDNKDSNLWTDEDGWTYTGQHNKFGEEFIVVGPDFEWYRPNNTYGDKDLPQPPLRLRSVEQSEKDRIFGFPPRIGERNLPRVINSPFILEDVYHERAKIKAREEARQKGIVVDRSMSVPEIEALIGHHDKTSSSQSSEAPAPAPARSLKHEKPVGSRKRRRTEPVVQSEPTSTNESTHSTRKHKRRRKDTVGTPAPAPAPAPTQAPAPAPAPTPSAQGPPSEKPKTLKLKLIFSKRETPTNSTNTTNTSDKSKKRPHSEPETNGDKPASHGPSKSPNASSSNANPTATPRRLLKLSTPKQERKERTNDILATSTPEVPASAEQNSHATPGGRPRRRAAAALMAEFQNHAEKRARRANARKKTNAEAPDETHPGQGTGSTQSG